MTRKINIDNFCSFFSGDFCKPITNSWYSSVALIVLSFFVVICSNIAIWAYIIRTTISTSGPFYNVNKISLAQTNILSVFKRLLCNNYENLVEQNQDTEWLSYCLRILRHILWYCYRWLVLRLYSVETNVFQKNDAFFYLESERKKESDLSIFKWWFELK